MSEPMSLAAKAMFADYEEQANVEWLKFKAILMQKSPRLDNDQSLESIIRGAYLAGHASGFLVGRRKSP